MTVEQIWMAALGELQLQMTKATFDTWVKPAQAASWKDGVFVIGVPNEFARDWLENRLGMAIARVLVGIAGQPVEVRFVVATSSPVEKPVGEQAKFPAGRGVVAVKFYEFDPRLKWGFLQASKYHYWFWQPLVGSVAWATYLFLRSLDKQNEGWGGWNLVSVDEIAATVAEGRRQLITGVSRKRRKTGEEYWQKGAFDRLSEAGIAKVETFGGGNNISYQLSVLNDLPLLVPEQVETLPEILQVKHARKLKECSINYEEWEQLALPTLVR